MALTIRESGQEAMRNEETCHGWWKEEAEEKLRAVLSEQEKGKNMASKEDDAEKNNALVRISHLYQD